MDLGLEGRPAAVAAASRGLGFACALALAREGARVAICSRDAGAIADARERMARETGAEVVAVTADVSRKQDAERFVDQAVSAFGGCQILVANAGGPPPGRADQVTDGDFLHALELNFLSTVRMTHRALPHMREAGYGRVVYISSLAAKQPIPGLALSNSSRAATTGFLKTLAREVASEGITVNAVLPGRFLTNRIRELAAGRAGDGDVEREIAREAADIPAGRLGDPAELGDLVAFIASERAEYLTGCLVQLDGGLYAGVF